MVKRQEAIVIEVDEQMKVRARNFAIKAVDETFDRFQYNRKERLEKIAWGKLGEEVLTKYFSNHGINVEIDYSIYIGTSSIDETDFKIGDKKIEIKVGTKDFHKRLLVVKSYFDNGHQSDYYIAINFYNNANEALIFGYATKLQVAESLVASWDKTNPIQDYTMLYDELSSIDELLAILKK